MRITSIKKTSFFMIVCAMIMIFAHIVIPHVHSCFGKTESLLESCCLHENNQQIDESHPRNLDHHHCIVVNIVYQNEDSKDTDYNLVVLSVEHFGYIYNPITLSFVADKSVLIPSENIALRHVSSKLIGRAPPIVA